MQSIFYRLYVDKKKNVLGFRFVDSYLTLIIYQPDNEFLILNIKNTVTHRR